MKALRPKAAAEKRSALYRGHAEGRWDRIGRGIYLPADAPAIDWDQLEAATRRPEATICLLSALARYDLTDAIPDALDVAIPRGMRTPMTESAICWHRFDAATFKLGRDEILIPGSSQHIGLYSAERTIVDCFRLRSTVGYEVVRDATKEWLRRGGKPAELMAFATQLPRAKAPLLQTLEVIT
ncbi:type IV toxin-antitoxin system AbiEi family antitoxin domain-containing protein [Leucobacter sp. W1038]|uniref:type IV toxin-antitoxin system AbiEi family antitoxin domain-containing protein n=1 Tax=Leucobacter sp. W1038 TaxID=3438281 RepID=UPI003D95F866